MKKKIRWAIKIMRNHVRHLNKRLLMKEYYHSVLIIQFNKEVKKNSIIFRYFIRFWFNEHTGFCNG